MQVNQSWKYSTCHIISTSIQLEYPLSFYYQLHVLEQAKNAQCLKHLGIMNFVLTGWTYAQTLVT